MLPKQTIKVVSLLASPPQFIILVHSWQYTLFIHCCYRKALKRRRIFSILPLFISWKLGFFFVPNKYLWQLDWNVTRLCHMIISCRGICHARVAWSIVTQMKYDYQTDHASKVILQQVVLRILAIQSIETQSACIENREKYVSTWVIRVVHSLHIAGERDQCLSTVYYLSRWSSSLDRLWVGL